MENSTPIPNRRGFLIYLSKISQCPKKIIPYSRGTFIAFAIIFNLALINISQILSFIFYPFSIDQFRRVNTMIVERWWRSLVNLVKNLSGVQFFISGDDLPFRENAIILSNHQAMCDILALEALALEKEAAGDTKYMAKEGLKYVPGLGSGMKLIGCIFLKRNWDKDREGIYQAFHHITQQKIPLWFTIFPEGTRLTKKKLEQSRNYAQRQGLPILSYLLNPRVSGFRASVQGLRHHVTAVYDVTIAYPENPPHFWKFICGEAPRVDIYVKRYSIGDIPKGDAQIAQWLVNLFAKKNELLSHYQKYQVFPSQEKAR